jgi:hypothetical protein
MHTSVANPPDSAPIAAAPDATFAQAAEAAREAEARAKPSFDALGIALAVLCGIHCVATPLLALLPLGSIFVADSIEWMLPAGAVLLGLGVIATDTLKVHRRYAPAVVLGGAALLLAIGHGLHGVAGTALAVAGSVCLAAALVLNVRLRRRARTCPRGPATAR